MRLGAYPIHLVGLKVARRAVLWVASQGKKMTRMTLPIVSGILAFSISVAREQSVIYVKADAASGGDGTSWASAFNDLQDALVVATAGDQLWAASGTYTPGPWPDDR